MPHLSHQAPPRSLRLMAVALALVLISLLVNAGAPAPNVEAGKDASVSITADKQNVNAGDTVKLKIKLQNVKNATLNGVALKDGKDKVEKKVLVCATTTYTVEAMPKDGGPKISQSLTINATGTTANKDCPSPAAVPMTVPNPLPDLAFTSFKMVQQPYPNRPGYELVSVEWEIHNKGQATAADAMAKLYADGKLVDQSLKVQLPAGQSWTGGMFDDTGGGRPDGQTIMYTLVIEPQNAFQSDTTNNTRTATLKVMKGLVLSDTVQEVNEGGQKSKILKLLQP